MHRWPHTISGRRCLLYPRKYTKKAVCACASRFRVVYSEGHTDVGFGGLGFRSFGLGKSLLGKRPPACANCAEPLNSPNPDCAVSEAHHSECHHALTRRSLYGHHNHSHKQPPSASWWLCRRSHHAHHHCAHLLDAAYHISLKRQLQQYEYEHLSSSATPPFISSTDNDHHPRLRHRHRRRHDHQQTTEYVL